MSLFERDLLLVADHPGRKSVVNAPPVKNLVCAPPSETPGKVNCELLMISAMKSALNPRFGPRNSAFRLVSMARSSITSTGCLFSSVADLAERLADILFESVDILDPLHDQMLGMRRRHRPASTLKSASACRLAGYRCAEFGPLHLVDLLRCGAGGQLAPCRAGVVKVPVFEREGEATADRARLAEDRRPLARLRSIQRRLRRWISGFLRVGATA